MAKKSNRCFAFPLDLVKLEASTAKHILDNLLAVLTKKKNLMKHLNNHLFSTCSDSASVMVREKLGSSCAAAIQIPWSFSVALHVPQS